jgi:hypothetical protein
MKRIAVVTLLTIGSHIFAGRVFAQTLPASTESVAIQQSQDEVPPQQPATMAQPSVEQKADASKPKDEAPKHASTGWSALFKDTVRDFKHFPMRQSTWVILGIGGASSYVSHFGDDYVTEHIVGNPNADKFFSLGQWVGSSYTMVASSVGLWAVGRYVIGPSADEPKTNKWSEMGFDMMRAQMLAQAVTQGTKQIVRRDRPTGECCSFPSGHAASAFAAAAVLERHLYRGSWPFMVGAMYVGASRLVDNRHFLSDVMFGAAVGTAAGWTVVSSKGGGNHAYIMQPVPVEGGMMIAVSKVQH